MALVDDDDAERVLTIVLGQEAGEPIVVIQTERLVGGDMDPCVLRGVAAPLRLHDAGVVTEGGLELVVGLLAKFIPVTQEERWFGELASLRQPPEQVRGDRRR